jgi:DNA helicase-2/ATP-dependent DNA helicase PcrA
VVAAAKAVLGRAGLPLRSSRPDGPVPAVRAYPSDRAEAGGVAGELRRAHAGGLPWSQLAVLARTNAQAASFRDALTAAQVPFQLAVGDTLLDDPEVVAVLEDLRRRSLAPFAVAIADLGDLVARSGPVADGAGEDPNGPGRNDHGRVAGAQALGCWDGEDRVGAAGGSGSAGAPAAVLALARSYQRLDPGATTKGFLTWLRAAGARGDRPDPAVDAVTVCTFHRAKGLGWAAVWVTGLEHGLVPIGHALTPEAEAEERRLLYVALTRAERELRCSWAETRRFGGRPVPRAPSPWLAAISDAVAAPDAIGDPATWRRRLGAARARLANTSTRPLRDGPGPDPAVLRVLRDWRARTARAASVPPSVLLHDATLSALASARPATIEDLLTVPGIGGVKAARYGDALLALLADCGMPA